MDPISPDLLSYIVRAHHQGANAEEISVSAEIPAYRVRILLKEAGLSLTAAKRSAKRQHLPLIQTLIAKKRTAPEIADEINVPYTTLSRWLRQEGLTAYSEDQRRREDAIPTMLKAARAGESRESIADRFGFTPDSVSRWLAKEGFRFQVGGRKIGKKPSLLPNVIALHHAGIAAFDIATQLGIHYGTAEIWLRELGLTPINKERPARLKPDRSDEIAESYLKGNTIVEVAKELNISQDAVRKIIEERGITTEGGIYLRDREQAAEAVRYFDMGMTLSDVCDTLGRSYQTVRGWLVAEGRQVRSPGRKPRA